MKSLVLILFVAFASAKPAPGGYTASGGVFNPDRHLDYMNEARHAGKFAWGKKFEQELEQVDVDRGERQTAPYIPTFFTNTQQQNQYPQQVVPQFPLQHQPPIAPFAAPAPPAQQQRTIYYQQYKQ